MTANPIPISPLENSSAYSRHYDSQLTFDAYALPPRSHSHSPKSSSHTTTTIREVARSSFSASDHSDDEPRRGRDSSPRHLPNLHSPSISPIPLGRSRRSSRAAEIESHHHLPSTAGGISSDPVLYLPPLMSPLPDHLDRRDSGSSTSSRGKGQLADGRHKSIPVAGGQELILNDFRTRLPDIDPASLALHQVLHHFRPVNNKYAKTPYDEAFNWNDLLLPTDVEREWYCVVFRSLRKPESSNLSLYTADREAHEEAVKNGGLVMYWYGVPDNVDGSNLATCIWQSRKHAINAISGPKHRSAMLQAKDAYQIYDLERWVLRKGKGQPELSLSTWQGGEVGW